MANNRQIGALAEDCVCRWLESKNYIIKDRNFHAGRTGEIDVIARDGKYLCFIEVKFRRTNKAGTGAEAVTYHKRKTISKVALYYLHRYRYPTDTPVRFDVAEVSGEDMNIHYITNAFEFTV